MVPAVCQQSCYVQTRGALPLRSWRSEPKRSRHHSFRALGFANLVRDLEAAHGRLLGDPNLELVDRTEPSSSLREAGFLPSCEILIGDRPAFPLAEELLKVEVKFGLS